MRMLVMNIRIVGMLMRDHGMPVQMHVRLSHVHPSVVLMPVMLLMSMCMCVLQWLVGMFMFVSLSQMKPHTQSHQR